VIRVAVIVVVVLVFLMAAWVMSVALAGIVATLDRRRRLTWEEVACERP
jgi:hypothetical protein